MTKFMPTEIVHTDVLTAGHHASGGGGGGEKLDLRRARFKLNENAETDRQYIESCFGRSLYPPEELAAVEQQLCTGVHAGCHLWFTAGAPDPEKARSGDSQRLTEEAALQAQRKPRGLRQRQQPVPERHPAPDRADPQLHPGPQPGGDRDGPQRPAGQPPGVAGGGGGGRPRLSAGRQRRPARLLGGPAAGRFFLPDAPVRRRSRPRAISWPRACAGARCRCGCPAFAACGATPCSGC